MTAAPPNAFARDAERDLERISARLKDNRGDELLTSEEVATYLKVSVKTVVDWRYRGTGPKAVAVGRSVRYRKADLTAWLAENTVTPKARG